MGRAVPRSNRLLIRIENFIFAQISILSAPIAGKTSRVGQIYPWIEKLFFLKIGCPGWGYFQGSFWLCGLDLLPARLGSVGFQEGTNGDWADGADTLTFSGARGAYNGPPGGRGSFERAWAN